MDFRTGVVIKNTLQLLLLACIQCIDPFGGTVAPLVLFSFPSLLSGFLAGCTSCLQDILPVVAGIPPYLRVPKAAPLHLSELPNVTGQLTCLSSGLSTPESGSQLLIPAHLVSCFPGTAGCPGDHWEPYSPTPNLGGSQDPGRRSTQREKKTFMKGHLPGCVQGVGEALGGGWSQSPENVGKGHWEGAGASGRG